MICELLPVYSISGKTGTGVARKSEKTGSQSIQKESNMNWKKISIFILICLLAAVLVSGCVQSNQERDTEGSSGVAGFWPGLWHGLILPVAFIISLFDDGTGIYEIHNNGNWYNFGFVLGTWFVFGSFLAGNKKRR